MKTNKKETEHFSFNILGIKAESSNPGWRTILILIILLIFALAVIFIFKADVLPGIAFIQSKNIIAVFASKLSQVIKFFKIRSP